MPYISDFAKTLYDARWLRKKYKRMNAPQIAELLGCTYGAVLDNLRKHKIPIERGRFAKHVGSHAPRPRRAFVSTLHNPVWLREQYVDNNRNASEVAHLAGASIPATFRALRVAGIRIKSHGEAKRGRPNLKLRLAREDATTIALRVRARRATLPGPCAVCGDDGIDVNHKDRNPRNPEQSNLERLCRQCHGRQHAEEERVMIELLVKHFKFPYIRIHHMARKRLLQRNAA